MTEREEPFGGGRSAAERYLCRRLEDAEYAEAYRRARAKIDRVDAGVRAAERREKSSPVSRGSPEP